MSTKILLNANDGKNSKKDEIKEVSKSVEDNSGNHNFLFGVERCIGRRMELYNMLRVNNFDYDKEIKEVKEEREALTLILNVDNKDTYE